MIPERKVISVPPKNPAEALAREAYAAALHDVQQKRPRALWRQPAFWRLALKRVHAITQADVDKHEFDSAFVD